MTNYYSQHGEDFLMDIMLQMEKGFFVEVGCIDGKIFSNTLSFEERGWKGLCVEAHADYIQLIKQNRPGSIVCHYAVGEKDEDDVIFYANNRGSLSTLDKSKQIDWKKNYAPYFHGFDEQHVAKKTLSTIFRENQIQKIDILSVDIEGYELQALKGLDFHIYKPTILVVEADNPDTEQALDDYLLPLGYIKSVRLASNVFYVISAIYHQHIIGKVYEHVKLIQTPHPVDGGEGLTREIELDARQSNVLIKEQQPSRGFLARFFSKK